jgi:hypothetical protein
MRLFPAKGILIQIWGKEQIECFVGALCDFVGALCDVVGLVHSSNVFWSEALACRITSSKL